MATRDRKSFTTEAQLKKLMYYEVYSSGTICVRGEHGNERK
jgi:hypothetical protein